MRLQHVSIAIPPDGAGRARAFYGGLLGLVAPRARLEDAGAETSDPTPIVGRPRFFVHDPFGNLVELTRLS